MARPRSSPKIECPIDLFEGCESQIERLTAAINFATAPKEKGVLARELSASVKTLLDCKEFDLDDTNCRLCRDLSRLRHKTAAVIDMATALGR